jgi:signal transduction histidine kinase
MLQFFDKLFSEQGFMPHGHCYFWGTDIIALHVISDAIIALSYYSIPLTLIYFVHNKRDLPYKWMFLMFGAFILSCGTTHIMEILVIWHPLYWLSGFIKLFTALISIATAAALIPLIPKALALRSPKVLEEINRKLEKEIAERKQTESALSNRSHQLEEANKELEAFSYSVSHDLRAPLRSIEGFTSILTQNHSNELSEKARRYFSLILSNSRQMGALIDDLLTFSRLSRQPLQKKNINLKEFIGNICDELKSKEFGRKIEITIQDMPNCQGDPSLLRQVFVNLVANAIKFTRNKDISKIEVWSEKKDGQNVYCIKDNGVGFDMNYASKLFGVFQRMHKAEDYEGTGVGLAIVQRIVSRHGGHIWAESVVNEGTTFSMTLDGNIKNESTHA